MWVVLGLVIGVFCGLASNFVIPAEYSKFVAIGILAALDSGIGALLAHMQKTFDSKIFITGFFSNALMAMVLAYIGHLIDVDISLAAIIVFGTRIFNNFATIRRMFFAKRKMAKSSGDEKSEKQQQP